MLAANILLALTGLVVVILMTLIIASGPKKRLNIITTVFLGSLLFWVITNFITNISNDAATSLFFARMTLIGAALVPITFLGFTWTYLGMQVSRKQLMSWCVLPVIIVLLSPTKYNVESIDAHGLNTVVGIAYFFVLIEFIVYFTYSLRLLLAVRRHKDTSPLRRKQITYIFNGAMLTLVPALIANAILPILGFDLAAYFGPSTVIFLALSTGTAIFRYGFLDIRLVIARLLGYGLSILTLSLIYGFIAFNVINFVFFGNNQIDLGQRLVYTSLAVVIAFTLRPLKSFFDKLTNKLFYQDSYDSQQILDKVSGVIVGNVDPHKVQNGALEALSDALRPTYMTFILGNPNGSLRNGDGVGQKWHPHDLPKLQSVLKKISRNITIFETIDNSKKNLIETLKTEDINLVAPLVTKEEVIGYIIMGQKKSGNIYNNQDKTLLTIASNELAVALQNAQRFEEIQAFNLTLQEKVTEATRELKSTNKKLVALDEAKDEFISMASHQLRTPLTSIKGYLSMMVDGDLGKVTPAQEKALKEAFGSSQRMVFLIADFLNVSRIKTGKFVIEPREVNLPEIVREEITQLREMASSRELNLVYEQPGEFPKVMLDDNKIRQVMMNMVDNAIYYTPSGGTITIQLYPTATDIIFKVIDTGIGVPKAEQHKLFAKFFRANNARRARPDGTGLGLFMAQKIIVEQGGAIIFESTEGKGSTFGFQFPIAKIRA